MAHTIQNQCHKGERMSSPSFSFLPSSLGKKNGDVGRGRWSVALSHAVRRVRGRAWGGRERREQCLSRPAPVWPLPPCLLALLLLLFQKEERGIYIHTCTEAIPPPPPPTPIPLPMANRQEAQPACLPPPATPRHGVCVLPTTAPPCHTQPHGQMQNLGRNCLPLSIVYRRPCRGEQAGMF